MDGFTISINLSGICYYGYSRYDTRVQLYSGTDVVFGLNVCTVICINKYRAVFMTTGRQQHSLNKVTMLCLFLAVLIVTGGTFAARIESPRSLDSFIKDANLFAENTEVTSMENFLSSWPCFNAFGIVDPRCKNCYTQAFESLHEYEDDSGNAETLEMFKVCSDRYRQFPTGYNQTGEFLNMNGKGNDSFAMFCESTREFSDQVADIDLKDKDATLYYPFYIAVNMFFNATENSKSDKVNAMRRKLCTLNDQPRLNTVALQLKQSEENLPAKRQKRLFWFLLALAATVIAVFVTLLVEAINSP